MRQKRFYLQLFSNYWFWFETFRKTEKQQKGNRNQNKRTFISKRVEIRRTAKYYKNRKNI